MAKKFVASYSGGKDSILALHRAVKQGGGLVALITTYNTDQNRSWFHGLPKTVLKCVAESLNTESWLIETTGDKYAQNFEKKLLFAKERGAEVCVFGDIDIKEHRQWCMKRCESVGIEAMFPLWNENRKRLVYEFIENDFVATITVVDTTRLSEDFLGVELTKEVVNQIELSGADICGENGEYHTFVSNGPIFKIPIEFSLDKKMIVDDYAILSME